MSTDIEIGKLRLGYYDLEDFASVCRNRYPGVVFIAGLPQATDSKGKAYTTLAIGGIKPEGSDFTMLSTLNPTDTTLLEKWFETFDKFIEGCYEVHIRKPPCLVCETRQEIDNFNYEFPTIVNKTYTQITGRFSFYK